MAGSGGFCIRFGRDQNPLRLDDQYVGKDWGHGGHEPRNIVSGNHADYKLQRSDLIRASTLTWNRSGIMAIIKAVYGAQVAQELNKRKFWDV